MQVVWTTRSSARRAAGAIFWAARIAAISFIGGALTTSAHAARVSQVSPQGEVAEVRQIVVRFDAAVVALDRLDAWRIAHPDTALRRTPYLHPFRVNIGFVARSDAPDVLAAANRVIERSLANGDLQRWSAESGVTWVAPAPPQVGTPFVLADLLRE